MGCLQLLCLLALLSSMAVAGQVDSGNSNFPCEPGLPLDGHSMSPTTFYNACEAVRAYDEAFAAINMTYKVKILHYLENKMASALECDTIEEMSAGAFAELLCRPWRVEEVRVFRAVWRWHQKDFGRWEGKSKELLNRVHLVAIPADVLQEEVLPSKLFECALIVDALVVKVKHAADLRPYLRFTGQTDLNLNVVDHSLGALAVTGTDAETLLCKPDSSTKAKGASHLISDPTGITIKLGREHILNTVTVHLRDDDARGYSYFVEVSVDGTTWTRVVDRTSVLVKGRVKDFFKPTSAAFIRVVGTRNTNERHNTNFYLNDLQASLS